MHYSYYQFVRFVAMVIFSYLAYSANELNKKNEVSIYLGLALLFQPFMKIVLWRIIWNIVNLVAGIGLIISLSQSKSKNNDIVKIVIHFYFKMYNHKEFYKMFSSDKARSIKNL